MLRSPRAWTWALRLGWIGAAAVAACTESSPTGPAPSESRRSAAATEVVQRMPVVRVVRVTFTPTAQTVVSGTPGPAATPTPTHTRAPLSTRTHTPTITPTPTITLTPTPAPIVIRLAARSWQWSFVQGPAGSIPNPPGNSYPGLNTINLVVGQTYELHIYNDSPQDNPNQAPHTFSGVPILGLSGGQLLYDHGNEIVQTFTPTVPGSFPYNCDDTGCSTGDISMQHDLMHGFFTVHPAP